MQPADVDSLLDFCERAPERAPYPRDLIKRFVTELISDPKLIFQRRDSRGQLEAAAVLLDKIKNPGNDACLEVLGIASSDSLRERYKDTIEWAKQNLPTERSGFQLGLAKKNSALEDLLLGHRLTPAYETFEMKCEKPDALPAVPKPEISRATREDGEEFYEVLCQTFAENPETSITERGTWLSSFLRLPKSHYYVWKTENKIFGIANLIEADEKDENEIRTLGVLRALRGRGVGRALLAHCLAEAARLNSRSCHLTVAAKNTQALGIYEAAGFVIMDSHRCYRFARN